MATLKKLGTELVAQLAVTPQILTLYELRKDQEEPTLKKLKLLVTNLALYFHTTQVVSKSMIEEIATRILYRFAGLSIEDVALCFHKVQNGDYGDVFNRLDGGVVMKWLQKYEAELQRIGMERDRRLHNQDKTGITKNGHDYRLVTPARIKNLM